MTAESRFLPVRIFHLDRQLSARKRPLATEYIWSCDWLKGAINGRNAGSILRARRGSSRGRKALHVLHALNIPGVVVDL